MSTIYNFDRDVPMEASENRFDNSHQEDWRSIFIKDLDVSGSQAQDYDKDFYVRPGLDNYLLRIGSQGGVLDILHVLEGVNKDRQKEAEGYRVVPVSDTKPAQGEEKTEPSGPAGGDKNQVENSDKAHQEFMAKPTPHNFLDSNKALEQGYQTSLSLQNLIEIKDAVKNGVHAFIGQLEDEISEAGKSDRYRYKPGWTLPKAYEAFQNGYLVDYEPLKPNAIGTALSGSTINPITSGGGSVVGLNRMYFLDTDTFETYIFREIDNRAIGFDVGGAGESVWAWGKGRWDGISKNYRLSIGDLTGSIFWSEDYNWIGITFGFGIPFSFGLAHEEICSEPWDGGSFIKKLLGGEQ